MRHKKPKKEKDNSWKLQEENKRLKKQISKLRKVISRLDFEQYQNVREIVEAQERQDEEFIKDQRQKSLEERWKCFKCEDGVMRLLVVHRAGNPYYLRKCDCCTNKTKMKKYTDEVEGA